MSKLFTHKCHACGGGIPYDHDTVGKEVTCPHCGQYTNLGESYPEIPDIPAINPWNDSEATVVIAAEPAERRSGVLVVLILLLVGGGGFATWWFGFKDGRKDYALSPSGISVSPGDLIPELPDKNPPEPVAPVVTNQVPATNSLPPVNWRSFIGTYRRNPYENEWHLGMVTWAGMSDSGKPMLKWRNQAGVEWPLYPTPNSWKVRTGKGNPYFNSKQGAHFEFQPGQETNSLPAGFKFNDAFYMRVYLRR